jgi:UDP-N-acetylmuramoyl-tripeptide--D-alanyl-D-alanine ligase
MRGGRRLVFVAGTMRELGPEAPRLHAEIAADLVRLEPDLLAAVGDFVPALEPHAPALGERLVTGEDVPALGRRLVPLLQGDELIVLKASRGVALERIIPVLTSRPVPGH